MTCISYDQSSSEKNEETTSPSMQVLFVGEQGKMRYQFALFRQISEETAGLKVREHMRHFCVVV